MYAVRKPKDLLHIALELIHGAFVQVTAEEREQVWGQEERLHQWTLGQLTCHLEYYVGPVEGRRKAEKCHVCSKILSFSLIFYKSDFYQVSKSPMLGSSGTPEESSFSPWDRRAYRKDSPNWKRKKDLHQRWEGTITFNLKTQTLFWQASERHSCVSRDSVVTSLRTPMSWLNVRPPITFRSGR